MATDQELIEAAERWHAPNCDADAGGGCIIHSEEKEAWVAGYEVASVDREGARDVIDALLDLVDELSSQLNSTQFTVYSKGVDFLSMRRIRD